MKISKISVFSNETAPFFSLEGRTTIVEMTNNLRADGNAQLLVEYSNKFCQQKGEAYLEKKTLEAIGKLEAHGTFTVAVTEFDEESLVVTIKRPK